VQRKTSRDVENAAVSLAALLSLVLLFVGQVEIGVIAWGTAFAGSFVPTVSRYRRRVFGKVLGMQPTNRILMLVAIGVLLADSATPNVWLAWIALVMTVFVTRSEGALRKLGTFARPRASGFELARIPSRFRKLSTAYGVFQCVSLLGFLVLALSEAPGGLWLIPSSACCLTYILIGADLISARRVSRLVNATLPDRVMALRPAFMVYWDAPKNSQYQLAMWIPHLRGLGLPFFVLVRNSESFEQAVSVCGGVPVVHGRTMADLERYCVPSLRAVFYMNNAARNSHCVRYSHLEHVQLLHGDSDKAPSFNPVTRMFDKIFVAGQAGIDRYSSHGIDISRDRFEIVGRPQVSGIIRPLGGTSETSGETLLYAPTWRGYHDDASYSSLASARGIIAAALQRGYHVIFRPHPYAYKDEEFTRIIRSVHQMLREDQQASGRQHFFGSPAEKQMSITECFNRSDLMVTDISSVVVDYLYSEKPLILVRRGSAESFVHEFPVAEAAYVVDGSVEELEAAFADIETGDPLATVRSEKRAYYLGDFSDDGYEGVFRAAARRAVLGRQEMNTASATAQMDYAAGV